ncbi:NAD(P)/FAD-dependent oxidoreductase [Nocardia neocaledoniensis]|uniref:NAD(P)/FAD-dependent oxidoreductase n=1 Tax=Nocardia neocaledoniensis TaxID=236511 RepID=UPI002455DBE3|nr:FAD-dependent oxidoreductase [Nocardia neocaledoniensis]
MSGRIVVVGAGVAGATAAQTLRREGYTGEIVLVGAEPDLPYRRPAVSKDLLAGTGSIERAALKPAAFWAQNRIELRPGVAVEAIDTDRATVRLATGETLGYDSLLLATGARPRTLDTASARVRTLRARADIEALRADIGAGGSLLIVGGGLIGCEVAATARGLGARVTLLNAGPALMDRVLPAPVSELMGRLHHGHGVRVENDVVTTDLVDTDAAVTAVAADGRTWSGAAALVAVGSVPDTTLAESAGIAVDDGIIVDHHHRTSAHGVFAAGDATTVYHPLRGAYERPQHWSSAMTAGAAAALSMLGLTAPAVEVPWGWTDQHGRSLQFAGWLHPHDELIVDGDLDSHDFLVTALHQGIPVGAAAMARPRDLRAVRTLIDEGRPYRTPAVPAP